MSLSPLVFTGVSQYSTDFQTILDRAVRIAQIPLQSLQYRDADALQQKSLWSGVAGSVAGLASAIEGARDMAAARALAASSSNPSAVSVTNSGATAAASYTVESITSVAKPASERTLIGYADSAATPVSANGTLKLVIGDQNYEFTLADNTLVALRDKINSLGAGVAALHPDHAGRKLSLAFRQRHRGDHAGAL